MQSIVPKVLDGKRSFSKIVRRTIVFLRARIADAGRMITAGGITSGIEMAFHRLRRAGTASTSKEVARVMESSQAYRVYRYDIEVLQPAVIG